MITLTPLNSRHCKPCDGSENPLTEREAGQLLTQLSDGWTLDPDRNEIRKMFSFKGFYQTMAFVNALAWIAHKENHHPDFEVGYSYCLVRYSTHAIGGLSVNDFICAAMIDDLER